MKAAFRVALVACCVAALIQAATLARYPYVQNVRGDRATIIWTTLESGGGVVQYATDRGFSCTTCFVPARPRDFPPSETGLVFTFYQYEAEITGLRPATDYFYRVTVDGQNLTLGDELHFRTSGSNPFTFLVIGDSGQGTPGQKQIAARMLQEATPAPPPPGPPPPMPPATLVLHVGDIAYGAGRFDEFQQHHFDIYQDLMKHVPFFPSPGNHEYDTNNAAPYLAVHSLPTEDVPAADRGRYYSFDWSTVHFIALDSNVPLQNAAKGTGPMLQWLERDLQRTRKYWRIAYFHHPPYASGRNEGDPLEALARDYLVPILERYDVQLVLNGHEHSYRRTFPLRNGVRVPPNQGTVYITAGGGGASLYPVPANRDPQCCPGVTDVAETAYHYLRGEVDGTRIIVRAIRHCEPPRTGCTDGQMDFVTLDPRPEISAEAIVNAASYTTALAPGALISIFGRNLALEERQAPGLPLPFEMSRIGLTLNGSRLPLLYVSPSQINAQLPFDMQGRGLTLRLAAPNAPSGVEILLNVAPTAPAIFTIPTEFGVVPAVVHANGSLVTPASPAETGEFIAVYLTGLGQVDGPLLAGQPAPRSPLLRARAPVDVRVGNVVVAPVFAGLAPDFAGLYQVNLQVPGVPSGTHSLRIVAGGVSSNAVTLAVRSTAPVEPEPPPGSGSSIGRSLITPEGLLKKVR